MKLKLLVLAFLCSILSWGQTNPVAQSLPYTQNFSSLTGASPVYPAGWQGWNISGTINTAYVTTAPNADQAISVQTNATAPGALVGDFIGKIGVMSTGNATTGQKTVCLSINTTALTSIIVSYNAATQRTENTRQNGLGLQYRIGTSGAFTNVASSEYLNQMTPTNTTGTGSVNIQNISVTLPIACDNQSVVQLRWVIRDITGTGNRPGFSIDDVNVSGSPASSNTITTNTALAGSPFCVSGSTGATVSVPFTSSGTFNAGNVYTAQLSNAAGSFAAPTNIGTVTSTLNSDVISATIPAGTASGTGYRIRVISNNPVVTGTDNTVNLTVQNSAAITAQPSTTVQNVCQNIAATALSVTATGTTLTYQWYSNTLNSNSGGTLLATATSASYTPDTSVAGTLYYYCVVSAACGASVTSSVSGAVNVTSAPSAPSGTINVSANPSCGAATLTYSAPNANIYWQTSATGTSTANATTAPYTVSSNGTYYVRAFDGTCWSTGTVSQAVTVVNPITISMQPTSQSATTGNTATFSVTASNAAGYQWQVNTGSGWANIGGATSASYTTPAATLAMNGYQYQVIVTGNTPCGNVTSSAATLSVTTGPCLSENFNSNTLPAGWLQNGGTTFTGGEGVFGPQNCDLST